MKNRNSIGKQIARELRGGNMPKAMKGAPRDKMMRAENELIKAMDGVRDAVRDTSQLIRDIQYKGIKK